MKDAEAAVGKTDLHDLTQINGSRETSNGSFRAMRTCQGLNSKELSSWDQNQRLQ